MAKKEDPSAPSAAEITRMSGVHAHLALPEPDAKTKAELTQLDKTFMGRKVHRTQKFDDQSIARFLGHYALYGRKGDASRYAGVHYTTMLRHVNEDENLGQLLLEAHELYLNRLETEAYRRAVDGVLEPVIGGKDPEIVTYVRRYSDKLLELLLKKADPTGYGNRESKVSVNVNTGVLIAPVATTAEDTYLPIEDIDVL